MTVRGQAARQDEVESLGVLRGSARRAFLLAGTAMALPLLASAAQAQCTNTNNNNGQGFLVGAFGVPASFTNTQGTVSAIQSLTAILNTTNTAFLTQTSGFIGAPSNPVAGQQGGGVWARGIGGTLDTNTGGNYALGSPTNGLVSSGNCRTRTSQDYSGMQFGADISRLNVNGANFHMGVTAGYTESRLRSPTGNGTFTGDFQIPFVGVYAAVTKGGAYADGQVRWDFVEGRIGDPTNAIFNQRLDAQSLSFTGNVGQQFSLNDGYFLEPSAGGVYSSAKVDAFNLSGTLFQLNSPFFGYPSTVKISNFESVLGRVGFRAGKNIAVDGYVLQPFFTANVFHEFGGQVRALVRSDLGGLFTASGNPALGQVAANAFDTINAVRAGRIGTYGQLAVGVAGQVLNTGWLGYVRGDYRIGDRVEGWGLSGGLRYQFNPETSATTAIISKDSAPSSLVPAIEGPITWSGFSIGGSVGGTWGQTRQLTALSGNFGGFQVVPATVGRTDPHSAGVYAGGQIGADYQFGKYVVGVAGDIGFANAKGARGCNPRLGDLYFYNCETQVDMLSTATARVGYAYERSLFYVKGGAAFADVTERLKDTTGGQPLAFLPVANFRTAAVSTDAFGWTLGGGVEFAITRNWSAKAEYLHYELENKRLNYPLVLAFNFPNNSVTQSAKHTGDVVRIGVNYRFNVDTPVVAAAPSLIAKY